MKVCGGQVRESRAFIQFTIRVAAGQLRMGLTVYWPCFIAKRGHAW